MHFTSTSFAIFLPVVFLLYWFVASKNLTVQNALLLSASYFFYACWDVRFLALLLFSTLLDYVMGLQIQKTISPVNRKKWLWLSVGINLGLLAIFKYYNFFAASFAVALQQLGLHVSLHTLNIILPVGISFYTFHGLSYILDVYHRKINAEKDFTAYALFVSFFPLLVAGPIERATHLLPQLKKQRNFYYQNAADGLRQMIWGFFKKIVIADQCAGYVSNAFNHTSVLTGSTLAAGAILFAIQIYADFSGYSDIALGTARLFGIELLRNFAFPYFSKNMAEFWRRWNISLSSWFRDYVYIPLGGSRVSTAKKIRNVFIIFLLSGLWHGANWTFVAWGFLNALYVLPIVMFSSSGSNQQVAANTKYPDGIKSFLSMVITFAMAVAGWIFFRSASIADAFTYFDSIFSLSLFTVPQALSKKLWLCMAIFVAAEWAGRHQQYALARLGFKWRRAVRWAFYYGIILSILYFSGTHQPFIYFQF